MRSLRSKFALVGFAGALSLGSIACLDNEELGDTSAELTLSNYKAASITQSGNLITYTGPYLIGTFNYQYKVYQAAPYTFGATKWCQDQGYALSSNQTTVVTSARVAKATSLTAEWSFFGLTSNPTVNSAIVCAVPAPPTNAPTVTISANPLVVPAFGTSTLTWSSTNATSCTASGAWSGSKPTSGSATTAQLTQASTFTLTCTGTGGSTSASVTVTINPNDPCLGCWDY